ncbi:MAG: 2-C-methyl-D-erythritol 4-phosphate cytidylyltransferase [Clostridia bacterium]|nr:2-C-methyl-D-erythritol 4-phosphate cytidylyltransferase [Clostridia bacterium]
MNKTEIKLQYDVCEEKNQGLSVIIVAAGSSSRMQGKNKQFLNLNGIPVIVKTLLCFENCDAIKNIILVAKADDVFKLQQLAEEYSINKLTDIVCGGETRPESVLNGFARVAEDEEYVLIHDGARPFVTNEVICSVAKALESCFAVTCAVKVKDTIKEVDAEGKVIKTLVRDSLVAVQTPQGVRKKEYLGAVEKIGDVTGFTDDMSIMEAAGFDVFTVEGNYKNIKITTPEDVKTATAFAEDEF